MKSCVKCVFDTHILPSLEINQSGVCNLCTEYERRVGDRTQLLSDTEFGKYVDNIKRQRSGSYDCLIGLSGGVDSTYVAVMCKKWGLNPLALHVDNGWNTELAVKNIETIVKKLKIDLVTVVLDWPTFRDIQRSFFLAGTPDVDVPTDHAIQAEMWRICSKNKIKTILSGMNFATESVLPQEWAYGHSDEKYIRSVHQKFGKLDGKKYPSYSLIQLLIYGLKGIKISSPLNYVDYDKEAVLTELIDEYGWTPYGGKHHESRFTRFIQAYYLPTRFNIDKRYAHLASLINSGRISKEYADKILQESPSHAIDVESDLAYVSKKLEFEISEFRTLCGSKPHSFHEYPNNYENVQKLKKIVNWARSAKLYSK